MDAALWDWRTVFNVADNGVAGVEGAGFTYSGNSIAGGTITGAGVNITCNSDLSLSDVYITGLSLNASSLTPLINGGLTADQQNNLFWRTVLSGNDVINFGASDFDIRFDGDGANVESSQTRVGGADIMIGTAGTANYTDYNGGVIVSEAGLGYAGSIFIENFTPAQLADQLIFF